MVLFYQLVSCFPEEQRSGIDTIMPHVTLILWHKKSQLLVWQRYRYGIRETICCSEIYELGMNRSCQSVCTCLGMWKYEIWVWCTRSRSKLSCVCVCIVILTDKRPAQPHLCFVWHWLLGLRDIFSWNVTKLGRKLDITNQQRIGGCALWNSWCQFYDLYEIPWSLLYANLKTSRMSKYIA